MVSTHSRRHTMSKYGQSGTSLSNMNPKTLMLLGVVAGVLLLRIVFGGVGTSLYPYAGGLHYSVMVDAGSTVSLAAWKWCACVCVGVCVCGVRVKGFAGVVGLSPPKAQVFYGFWI